MDVVAVQDIELRPMNAVSGSQPKYPTNPPFCSASTPTARLLSAVPEVVARQGQRERALNQGILCSRF
jgi:hypothetical protein